jgi:diguanylate cyclase (GGDEF)-like protein
MSPFPDYPIPDDEDQRLRDLERLLLLDTGSDPDFDRITRLASEIIGTPIALISLVDRERQWFLSRLGLEVTETPRELAFCAHAIAADGVLVVADALEDSRFNTNPLVLSGPKIRFYAGAPLRTADGHNLGTLCVIDQNPRTLSSRQIKLLEMLAEQVIHEFEMRQKLSLCPVTGLHSRTSFFVLAEKEFQAARRGAKSLSLLMFDINNFRQLSHSLGLFSADKILLEFCALCARHYTAEDLMGRLSAEEFGLLLGGDGPGRGDAIAGAIRRDLLSLGLELEGEAALKVSTGFASMAESDLSFVDLFLRAENDLSLARDRALNPIDLQLKASLRGLG